MNFLESLSKIIYISVCFCDVGGWIRCLLIFCEYEYTSRNGMNLNGGGGGGKVKVKFSLCQSTMQLKCVGVVEV